MKTLQGHTSPETAYLVDDYPYGFRLRCKIRYWLEYHPKRGFRLCSQTSNPKRPGLVWNKPKASTYQRFGGVMFLDDNGHVQWDGLTEYSSCQEVSDFLRDYGSTMPEPAVKTLRAWLTRKLSFEQSKIEGAVKCTITTTKPLDIFAIMDGAKPEVDKVETTVLTSDYSPDQLNALAAPLRVPVSTQLATL